MSALDIEQPEPLVAWLRASGHIGPTETPVLHRLAGGVSNRVVRVDRPGGESWVLKQALAKLRVAVDWFSSPERVHREAEGLRWLARLAPPGTIPNLIFEDATHHVLAMEAVRQPHANWKTLLLEGALDLRHVLSAAFLLGTIHRAARTQAGTLRQIFANREYFEGLRLEPFYRYTAGQVPAAADFLGRLSRETRAITTTLVHGDFSPKNILITGDGLVLLDHEVIHWGDPMFNIGFAFAHLLSKGHHLAPQREAFADAIARFWNHYRAVAGEALAGKDAEARAVRHTLGCLLARVAGRSQVEYLDPEARTRQRDLVVTWMGETPPTVAALAERFVAALARPSH